MQAGLERGYGARGRGSRCGADDLLAPSRASNGAIQEEQMEALVKADAFAAGVGLGRLDPERYENWERFARKHGIAGARPIPLTIVSSLESP